MRKTTTNKSSARFETTLNQRCVLGSMLSSETCQNARDAITRLSEDDFTDSRYKAAFQAVRAVAKKACEGGGDVKQLSIIDVLAEAKNRGTDDVVTWDFLDELIKNASLLVGNHIGQIEKARDRDRVVDIHQRRLEAAQSDGNDLEKTVADSRREFEQLQEEIRRQRESLTTSWITLGDLIEKDIPEPVSRIGNGLLEAGGFAILYGQSGIGKTFAALELACAHARGGEWFGFDTKPGRVGLFSLELSDYRTQQRLKTIQRERTDWTENLLIQQTSLTGFGFDILDEKQYAQLADWIAQQRIDLAIIDPINRIHNIDENSTQEMGSVCLQVHRLRHETGAAVLLLHHEPKNAANLSDMSALRGSGRLQNDPQLLMRLVKSKGHLQLRFPKVTNADEPNPIWLERGEGGRLGIMDGEPVDNSEGAAERRATIRLILQNAEDAMSKKDVCAALEAAGVPAQEKRVQVDLKVMVDAGEVDPEGPQNKRKYRWTVQTPSKQRPSKNESLFEQ